MFVLEYLVKKKIEEKKMIYLIVLINSRKVRNILSERDVRDWITNKITERMKERQNEWEEEGGREKSLLKNKGKNIF